MTQSKLKSLLQYNNKTGVFIWVNPPKNHVGKTGKVAGCIQSDKGKDYKVIRIDKKGYKAHRLAWLYTHGTFPDYIDHKDGNSLNNKMSNLKKCTVLMNNQNHTKTSNKSGLPVGVRSTKNGRYQARVKANGKTYHLGTFDSIKEASDKYTSKRLSLHYCPAIKTVVKKCL